VPPCIEDPKGIDIKYPTLAPTSGDSTTTSTHIMSPKKATTPSSILRTLDPNLGDEALIREAREQKRRSNSLEPREDELDEEINNLEVTHQ
jgi:hypothetical protein